jgi:DNA-binding NtrC family response regulator
MTPKILIVDDEPDVIEFQRRYLERRKYNVFTAANTPQAIEAVTKESPDIVFLDLRIETDTQGLVILEEIKKIRPDTTVFLVTGIIDREIESQALALGANEVLHKPLPNEELEKKNQRSVS